MGSSSCKSTLVCVLIVAFSAEFCLAADNTTPTLPDAPSAAIMNAFGAGRPDDASSRGTRATADSRDDGRNGSPRYWLERLLRDQGSIYSAPFHESALKWDFALPAGTLVLVLLDKHISGAVPRYPGSVSSNISNAGLFGLAGITGVNLIDGLVSHNQHADETGILGAESFIDSAGLYALVQLITGRDRPFQDSRKGHFFQHTSPYGNSFPSGHAMFSWDAATILAHEYPKGWVKVLAYGTATVVSVTRVTSGNHFPADAVAGSALGYLVARHIFHKHCDPSLSEACEAR